MSECARCKRLERVVSMLSCMVECGEQHSDKSRDEVAAALAAEPEQENTDAERIAELESELSELKQLYSEICGKFCAMNEWLNAQAKEMRAIRASRDKLAKAAEGAIPSSWLDPLLSGPTSVLNGNQAGHWGCPEVEALLEAIRERVRVALEGAERG